MSEENITNEEVTEKVENTGARAYVNGELNLDKYVEFLKENNRLYELESLSVDKLEQ